MVRVISLGQVQKNGDALEDAPILRLPLRVLGPVDQSWYASIGFT